MTPYYCVYHISGKDFAWISIDDNGLLYHGYWNVSIESALTDTEDNQFMSYTSPQDHLQDPDAATDLLVCYYDDIITTDEFYRNHPELLI